MGAADDKLPDLTRGIRLERLPEKGILCGLVGGRKVLLWREEGDVHVFDAECPHLGGPLDQGLVEDSTVLCPWHHARFDLRTGKATEAPAFDCLKRHDVRIEDGLVVVGKAQTSKRKATASSTGRVADEPMVIVGGGAAGFAAANQLRELDWAGDITLLSAEEEPPYDRTLLTKDFLDGHFGDDRLPIARHGLEERGVRVSLNTPVEAIDVERKTVKLRGGGSQRYGKLLLATGAAPRKPDLPGADLPHVHCLRSLADCRRILAAANTIKRAVVLGGSFIALEAAASLCTRGLGVHVVAPEERPMSQIFGPALSDLVIAAHRQNGVALHLGRKVVCIEAGAVLLDDGARLDAGLVVAGIGVTPRIELASAAGLRHDRGILVDSHLRTSAADIFAAGDIARWPDRHTRAAIRVEHWVVAERQGQTAAANMLGVDEPFEMIPFFWTKHFDLAIRYVGHAEDWDDVSIEGSLADRDALVRYRKNGRDLAVATVGRDLDSLVAEEAMASRLLEARA